ncbi:cytochrome P450 4C1-like [Arctopsyche grandis]|uniref:cytochrome P450 4C1-like n=1 Tax=Arctopsyche grandis TaxID=121162 RepID=UPI00406DA120
MILQILAICAVLGYLLVKYGAQTVKLNLWASQLPGPFNVFPLGCTYRFICRREEIFSRLRKMLKDFPQPVIKMWLGPKLIVLIREPQHLERILQSTKMIEKDSLMDFAKPFIGEGLITGSGPTWKAHRKLIMPTLATKAVESYCNIFHQQANILVEKMMASMKVSEVCNEIILEEYLHPCCIDIVCETVMDIKLNAQASLNHEFMEAAYMMYFIIIERMAKPWLQIDFLFRFSNLSKVQTKTLKILRSFISDVIHKKKDEKQVEIMNRIIDSNYSDKNGGKADVEYEDGHDKKIGTAIEQLVNAQYDNTLKITDEEMVDEMLTMFMASSDTIASITCFCLKMLAMHPHYQEQVVKEFNETLGPNGGPLDSSACSELTFLERCIKETIRLFPIAPFIVRINKEEFKLDDDLKIPEGVSVMMALFDVHRNPKYWKRPEEFYPDHFLAEEVASRPQYAYVPFSSGLRVCIGKLYAMISVKIMTVAVLQKFKLSCRADQPSVRDLRLSTDISVRARDGNNIILSHRK